MILLKLKIFAFYSRQEMSKMSKFFGNIWTSVIEYETPRLVKIHNRKLGLARRVIQLSIVSYVLGMILHKKSIITIFGHKHKIKNFINKFDIFHFQKFNSLRFCEFWIKITLKMINEFWTKWHLWTKNIITHILQSLYNFISTLVKN